MKYRIIKKSHKFMYPYIAVHGELPKNELPKRMRRMRRNSIYIREDIYNNPRRLRRVQCHEYREIRNMRSGMKYKQAHRRAGY